MNLLYNHPIIFNGGLYGFPRKYNVSEKPVHKIFYKIKTEEETYWIWEYL